MPEQSPSLSSPGDRAGPARPGEGVWRGAGILPATSRLLTVLFLAVVFTCFSKVTEENGEQMPCYFVTVSLQEVGGVETKNWTVPRRLSEFQNLHRRLSEVRTLVAQA